jgi:hypothetical protein
MRFAQIFASICILSFSAPLVASPLQAQDPPVLDALTEEMEAVFSETTGMIRHTMTVLGYAREIMEEEGGEPLVVLASALMHDVGIPQAREVHGSSRGEFQEIEGPPIARAILERHDVPADAVDHICGIVANHHSDKDPEIVTTLEFKILWDSDWLVNFPNRYKDRSNQEKEEAIETIFKTGKGKLLARQMFLEM